VEGKEKKRKIGAGGVNKIWKKRGSPGTSFFSGPEFSWLFLAFFFLLPLVRPLISGHSDVAIGFSRLAEGARVVRGPGRELISRLYNLVLRATLRNSFSDAQCGFKALRGDVARRLVPLVEDNGWFFDTELRCWPSATACASTK